MARAELDLELLNEKPFWRPQKLPKVSVRSRVDLFVVALIIYRPLT